MGITARNYQRWTEPGEVRSDGRPEAIRPLPSYALSAGERAAVLAICNTPENASRPPGQIVPALADQGVYLASESTFYRILCDEDQQHHRGRARRRSVAKPPVTRCAIRSNTVWFWDVVSSR